MTATAPSLNRFAFDATVHCLTGCAIGEVLGLAIATALGWHDLPSIVLAIVLAFVFGYALTIRLLRARGVPVGRAARTALASDTISITVISLAVAFVVTLPVNRWLISRGLGHAVIHDHARS